MASTTTTGQLTVRMRRDNASTPWGLRLRGGKDFGAPLIIERVTPGSLAERSGLLAGDQVASICGKPTHDMPHVQAQSAVRQAGDSLDLELTRGAAKNQASSPPPPASLATPTRPAASLAKPSQVNISPPPFQRTAPGFFPPSSHLSPPPPSSSATHIRPAAPLAKPAPSQFTTPGFFSSPSSLPAATQVSQSPRNEKPKVSSPPPPPKPSSTSRTTAAVSPPPAKPGAAVTDQQWGDSPICAECRGPIKGPYLMASGKTYCQDHLVCSVCQRSLRDCGFAEHEGKLFCEEDYKRRFSPTCAKCSQPVVGEVVGALDRHWHGQCFTCARCHRPIGGRKFHVEEDGQPGQLPLVYCEQDWEELFQKKCHACSKFIDIVDRFIEAGGKTYHPSCIVCSVCHIPLQGRIFSGPGGKFLCQLHAKAITGSH